MDTMKRLKKIDIHFKELQIEEFEEKLKNAGIDQITPSSEEDYILKTNYDMLDEIEIEINGNEYEYIKGQKIQSDVEYNEYKPNYYEVA